MRELTKIFTHESDGKEMSFNVHKMNALDGTYMLKFVAEKLIPLIDGFQAIFVTPDIENPTEEQIEELAKKRTDAVLEVIPKALASITQEELERFQKQCLKNVEAILPGGPQKVMTGDYFGVEEVEYDPLLALLLCYDVISFNFSGFFGGKGLSSLLPQSNSSKQNA